MQYRKFGNLGIDVSALGFGCMRLPTLGDPAHIDAAEATRMLRFAIANGVNYIDTAWPYHGENSETFLGQALGDGYRKKVFLATKAPVARIRKPAEFESYLERQLEKLQTDHIDFYLLHALNEQLWQDCQELGALAFLERAKAQGKIRFIGFSFHDSLPAFKKISDGYQWDFCQIQYNYMNESYQAGREGLQYAANKGLGVVIMEPLLGGRLAKAGNPALQTIMAQGLKKRTPVAWALDWLWDQPEVSLVLSGMSTMAQVKENVALAGEARINSFTNTGKNIIDKARRWFLAQVKVACTGCRYCSDCPAGVRIERIFELYNNACMYGEAEKSRQSYQRLINKGNSFSQCQDCGLCERVCPQGLKVRQLLQSVHQEFCK